MFSFTEKDLDAVALITPQTANNNTINVEAAVANAHQLRSVYVRSLVGNAMSNLKNRINNYRKTQRALAQLNAMSSRELADIGITRGGIEQAVMGDTALKTGFADSVKKATVSFVKSYEGWRLRRAGYAQLMAMDARQLSDIGLNRGDVAEAMAGHITLANDNAAVANNNGGRKVS